MAAKKTGAKKGAITKHIHRVVDGLLTGEELNEEDAALTSGVEKKNLDKARELGNGLLKDAVDTWQEGQDIRELQLVLASAAALIKSPRGRCQGHSGIQALS